MSQGWVHDSLTNNRHPLNVCGIYWTSCSHFELAKLPKNEPEVAVVFVFVTILWIEPENEAKQKTEPGDGECVWGGEGGEDCGDVIPENTMCAPEYQCSSGLFRHMNQYFLFFT